MQTTFKLRRFNPSDLERVIHINRVCLPENYTSFFFLDLHKRFPETFLVAEEKREVVGYVMCRIETGLLGFRIGGKKKGHVISIAVLPEYQRRGVAYALMQETMRSMLLYNAKECFLEVRASNTPAVNLYKKMGFEITRTLRRYYSDGENAYMMARRLPFKP
ncbi:ribosomal protein S18-alanine N-acetyltransferase [Candidatus Bathyarchaeota archaeon]|nr:ribosomal protein S18-alanine N-acetyltransferase [Candidatus Bathyarchaeota archaeon]